MNHDLLTCNHTYRARQFFQIQLEISQPVDSLLLNLSILSHQRFDFVAYFIYQLPLRLYSTNVKHILYFSNLPEGLKSLGMTNFQLLVITNHNILQSHRLYIAQHELVCGRSGLVVAIHDQEQAGQPVFVKQGKCHDTSNLPPNGRINPKDET